MTWWSEWSAVPRFALANSAIHCRFVDRFARSRVPSCFVPMVLSSRRLPSLSRVPASPVPRCQRYYEGATTSRLRVPGPLWFRFRVPRTPPLFVFAMALPMGAEVARRAWDACSTGVPRCRSFPFVDAHGISQVAWRSIPCPCPALRPRPSRRVLTVRGLADAAPGTPTPKAPAETEFRGLPHGFSTCRLRFTSYVAVAHARLASGRRVAPLPGGS